MVTHFLLVDFYVMVVYNTMFLLENNFNWVTFLKLLVPKIIMVLHSMRVMVYCLCGQR